jgi:FkbM family methyltransferase
MMNDKSRSRTKLRYRWDHRSPLHRAIVRAANRLLPLVPFSIKYAATDAIRRHSPPYCLLGPDSVAIQVGAPWDTLLAGRSRAMAFAQRTNPRGRVLVVEPDRASVDEFRRAAGAHGLRHVDVVHAAAWSERGTLVMKVDPEHPATNFTAGCASYSESEEARFQEFPVDAVPIDELVERAGYDRVDLVSITTNGAEEEILRGLARTIDRHRPHICLARTRESYVELMSELGYEMLGIDDRGFTFRHREHGMATQSPPAR